jgi:F-type H+-transporting ATPase subunit a
MSLCKIKYSALLILILLIGVNFNIFAQEHQEKEKEFNAGELIMEHVADAYTWHIATFGEKHVAIPLPVIVFSKEKGFNIFLSSEFHHGHQAYKGFFISNSELSPNKGKIVEQINGEEVRPLDLSITKNTLSLLLSVIFIAWLFISVAKTYKKREGKAPKGIQSALEPLILFIRDDVAKSSIGEKKYEKYTPYLLSIFFFVFINNLLGLIPIFPGGANLTGNIAITLVLALITFVITTVSGNKNYWRHIFWGPGIPWWLNISIMWIVELMGVFIKPFVLMVRLFANILAGHIVLLGFFSLIFIFGNMNVGAGYGITALSIPFTVFLSLLELLVAFIQAYVFTLLSALYFGMATEEHHS